jgi:hypothetical protein
VILIDTPRQCRFGRCRITCHMVSDIPGSDGTAELVRFAERIGMQTDWLQRDGTPATHFDLMGQARIYAAIQAGAKMVSPREIVQIIRAKRAAAP